MSKRYLDENQTVSKRQETSTLYYKEDDVADENDEELLDEEDWEDVPLDGISVTVSAPEGVERTKKKRKLHQYQRLKFGLHIALIPFMLQTLKERSKWTQDERLGRRLRRSVPKVITKRFQKWLQGRDFRKLRTLLLGLVFWFRSHYQINCNGFRQNFNRLQYLIKYSKLEQKPRLYSDILENQQWFYGERPGFGGAVEDVRQLARNKRSNRDILVIFFLIILKNLLPNVFELNLCFALPLHDYEIACQNIKWQMKSGVGRVPDRFDSDLILPNFWIELRFRSQCKEFYIIDPVVHLKEDSIVTKYSEDEPVAHFQPQMDVRNNVKQRFYYIVSINCENGTMTDVSPRYLPNLCYRFFKPELHSVVLQSLDRKSYDLFVKYLEMYSGVKSPAAQLMQRVAAKHYFIPETLLDMKRSPCYIIPSLLKSNEALRFNCQPIAKFRKEPVFLKCDVLLLKSQQHWAQLGRSVRTNSRPLKSKKYIPMSKRREKRLDIYEVRHLFSIEQTVPTPRLPDTCRSQSGQQRPITDVEFYKNDFGHVEIYSPTTVPRGFRLLPFRTKHIIKRFNKMCHKIAQPKIKYLDVVNGFDFREKPGYAIPIIKQLLVNDRDYERSIEIVQNTKQLTAFQSWNHLIMKLKVQQRLNDAYGDL